MSTTDYSQLTAEQIQELLAQRRAELSAVQAVAKEKGISTPRTRSEPKPAAEPADQLRAGIQRLARGQWRVNDESARRDRAQEAYDALRAGHFPDGLPGDLEAELRQLYEATLAEQDVAEQRRQANKKKAKDNGAGTSAEADATATAAEAELEPAPRGRRG
jgi:hypothetical protein